jgi:hypothetical protein
VELESRAPRDRGLTIRNVAGLDTPAGAGRMHTANRSRRLIKCAKDYRGDAQQCDAEGYRSKKIVTPVAKRISA